MRVATRQTKRYWQTNEKEEIRAGGSPQVDEKVDLHLLEPAKRGHVRLAHDLHRERERELLSDFRKQSGRLIEGQTSAKGCVPSMPSEMGSRSRAAARLVETRIRAAMWPSWSSAIALLAFSSADTLSSLREAIWGRGWKRRQIWSSAHLFWTEEEGTDHQLAKPHEDLACGRPLWPVEDGEQVL
jgi:hypothetical protein